MNYEHEYKEMIKIAYELRYALVRIHNLAGSPDQHPSDHRSAVVAIAHAALMRTVTLPGLAQSGGLRPDPDRDHDGPAD